MQGPLQTRMTPDSLSLDDRVTRAELSTMVNKLPSVQIKVPGVLKCLRTEEPIIDKRDRESVWTTTVQTLNARASWDSLPKGKTDLTHKPAVVCQNFDVSVRCQEEDEGSNGRGGEFGPEGRWTR
jgi:hypothetical protein